MAEGPRHRDDAPGEQSGERTGGRLTHAEPPSEWDPVLLRSVRERARQEPPSDQSLEAAIRAAMEPVADPEPPAQPTAQPTARPTARPTVDLMADLMAEPDPAPSAPPSSRRQPAARDQRPPGVRRAGDAARDLAARRARDRVSAPPVEPEPPVAAPSKPAKVSKHDQVAAQMPGVYSFKPRRTARRLLHLALLAGVAVTAYFGWQAYDVRDTESIGLAVIAAVAMGAVWAIRSGAGVTRLTVRQGQLEVLRQGERLIFDMASPYTLVEVSGRPGSRGWKVIFPRRGMASFKVDGSMVDPDDFMRVLRFFRPDLVEH